MTWQTFIKSRLATAVLGTILLIAMVFAARVLIQKHQVDSQIAKLQDQMNKIKQNNDQLTDLIQYFGTPGYQEQQAREKLNLKKNGEYVVGLPQNADSTDSAQTNAENNPSNLKQWFNYFFGNHE